jgi:hypothetical protein
MLMDDYQKQAYENLRLGLLQYIPGCHPPIVPTGHIWGQYPVKSAAPQLISLQDQHQANIWLQAMQPS